MPRPQPQRAPAPNRQSLVHQLREAIRSRGLSAYAVGQLAGIDQGIVSRFLAGTRGLSFDSADAIAQALGLALVERARPQRRGAARTAPGSTSRPGIAENGGGDARDETNIEGN